MREADSKTDSQSVFLTGRLQVWLYPLLLMIYNFFPKVVEYAPLGNLEEYRVNLVHTAWLFAVQLASVIAFLQERQLFYAALTAPFIMVFSPEKVCPHTL